MRTSLRNLALAGVITVLCIASCSHKTPTEPNRPEPILTPKLAAPLELGITAVSGSSVSMSWTDSAIGESGFKVERSTNGSQAFVQIATLPAETQTYTDLKLTAYTSYTYRVRAFFGEENSAFSEPVTVMTVPDPLPEPTNLVGKYDYANGMINLRWVDHTDSHCVFELEQTHSGTVSIDTISQLGAKRCTVESIAQNIDSALHYSFRIRARFDGVEPPAYSEYSSPYSMQIPQQPAAPNDLTVSATNRYEQCGVDSLCLRNAAHLRWTNVARRTTMVKVKMTVVQTNGASSTIIKSYGGDPSEAVIILSGDSEPDTKYTFQIMVVTSQGSSIWSHESAALVF